MTFTLSTVRERIRTQLMHASGMIEPLMVNKSAETLVLHQISFGT
jgi:hypothetical protein